jgi:hypothetical protein
MLLFWFRVVFAAMCLKCDFNFGRGSGPFGKPNLPVALITAPKNIDNLSCDHSPNYQIPQREHPDFRRSGSQFYLCSDEMCWKPH